MDKSQQVQEVLDLVMEHGYISGLQIMRQAVTADQVSDSKYKRIHERAARGPMHSLLNSLSAEELELYRQLLTIQLKMEDIGLMPKINKACALICMRAAALFMEDL